MQPSADAVIAKDQKWLSDQDFDGQKESIEKQVSWWHISLEEDLPGRYLLIIMLAFNTLSLVTLHCVRAA